LSEQKTITLRIDVDYPYPSSRVKSFFFIALGIKRRKGASYLKNARKIAEIINSSPKKVKAYWFFTPYTVPDQKLLDLLNPERHEVGLHVATNAEKELERLKKLTGRPVNYYTFHGTESTIAQLLWHRKIGQKQASVPKDFRLENFQYFTADEPSLDIRMYEAGLESVKEEAKIWINSGSVITMHPEWLYKRGEKNRRGPTIEALKIILGVP
jgi:hypothetical protein